MNDMNGTEKRICKECKEEKAIEAFEIVRRKDKIYHRRICFVCRERTKLEKYPNLKEKKRVRTNEYKRQSRIKDPAKTILWDCNGYDSKRGFGKNNLNYEFIQFIISSGCSYCKDRSIRITLDRVDNNKGHNKDNVVACCIRCNLIRGAMPFEAWLHIVPSVRSAKEMGLFGDWRSKPIALK